MVSLTLQVHPTTDCYRLLKSQGVAVLKTSERVLRSPEPKTRYRMLKISVVEGASRRRLVVEGKLIEPWAAELISEYIKAKEHLDGRELIIDITTLSAISPAGETALLELLEDDAKFRCGVFMTEVLKQLGSRRRSK